MTSSIALPASVLTCVFRPCRKMIQSRKLNHQTVFYSSSRGLGTTRDHWHCLNPREPQHMEAERMRWEENQLFLDIFVCLEAPRSACWRDNNYLYSLHQRNVSQLSFQIQRRLRIVVWLLKCHSKSILSKYVLFINRKLLVSTLSYTLYYSNKYS